MRLKNSNSIQRLKRSAAAFAFAALFALGTQAWAGLRTIFDPPQDMIATADAAQHREARKALAQGNPTLARQIWVQLAETYLAQNKLQEAAWTYFQAGERALGHRIVTRLEEILRTAKVVAIKPVGIGNFGALKVTFDNGMSAVFKTIDAAQEIAASRVDRFLGLDLVAVTVPRTIDGTYGSLQIWIEGAAMAYDLPGADPNTYRSPITSSDLFFLDHLLGNTDRHSKNYLIRPGNYIVAIDHGKTFAGYGAYVERTTPSLPLPRRDVYERLLLLDDKAIHDLLGDVLTEGQIRFFRHKVRAQITEIQKAISQHGENSVFEGADPYIEIQSEMKAIEIAVTAKDWRRTADLMESAPYLKFAALRAADALNAPNAVSILEATGATLYTRKMISASVALTLFERHVAQAPNDPAQANKYLAKWLESGPDGVAERALKAPWAAQAISSSPSLMENLIKGEIARGTLSRNWNALLKLKGSAWSDLEFVHKVALYLPQGPELNQLIASKSDDPKEVREAFANTIHSAILGFFATKPKTTSEGSAKSRLEADPETFFSYLASYRNSITPEALQVMFAERQTLLDYPRALARVIDLFPWPQFTDLFKSVVSDSMYGDAKKRLLDVLAHPNPGSREARALDAIGEVQEKNYLKSGAVTIEHKVGNTKTFWVEYMAKLGPYDIRLSGLGRSFDFIFRTTKNADAFGRLIQSAQGVKFVFPTNPNQISDIYYIQDEQIVFHLENGSQLTWAEISLALNEKPRWTERLLTENSLREKRLRELELKLGADPAQTKIRSWNPFAPRARSCPSTLVKP